MIPDTANALDGQFSDLKNRLRNHTGLPKALKLKFVDVFFKAWTTSENVKKDCPKQSSILTFSEASQMHP
jgi:hypothetical protein